jgi:dTDP-4-dehydrorhamnose reductase
MIRILLTGGSGQLGAAIKALDWAEGVEVCAPGRAALNLSEHDSIASYLDSSSWNMVINAAAYTAVDKAESNHDLAHAINARAPGYLADWCADHDCPILHVSTDYVFNGRKTAPYTEDDPTDPVSVYGQTKRAGEQAVLAANPRHVIMRTSWVVSPHGQNFVKTMLRLAAERTHLRIVNDQHGAPTVAADLARAVQSVALRQLTDTVAPSGIYHCTNAGETTWFGLAQAVFRLAEPHGITGPVLEPIATAQYPTPACRPANSRLDCQKIGRDFGVTLAHWTVALEGMMQQLLLQQAGEPLR